MVMASSDLSQIACRGALPAETALPVLAAGLSGTFSHMLVLLSPLMTCNKASLVTLQMDLSTWYVLQKAKGYM